MEYNDSIQTDRWENFYNECEGFLNQAIQGDKWFIWVAEIVQNVVSHIYVELIEKVPKPGRTTHPFGYVTNVYTRPPYRAPRNRKQTQFSC